VSFCVNWYLNPNAHVAASYVLTSLTTSSPANNGDFDGFGIRVHLDF